MAGSGSENRKRNHVHKARFSDEEDALLREQAERAGVSIAAVIRHAVFDMPPLPASRRPAIKIEQAARILGSLGPLKMALLDAAQSGNPAQCDEIVEAACAAIAEMRVAIMKAFGMEP